MGQDRVLPATWGQEKRLEFIEFRLQWEGRINRLDLVNYFSISIPQASLDFARYREIAPENAVYDVVQKSYVAGTLFRPVLSENSADGYLTHLWGSNVGTIDVGASFLGWTPPVAVVRDPARRVHEDVLKQFLIAIREKRKIRVDYQSMTGSQRAYRTISPHSFAFDGSRWHVRAFCHKHLDFRDFLLGRVRSAAREELSDVESKDDTAWHTLIEAVVVPNPDLPETQKQVVEHDYCMENGQLVLRVREALLFYHLEHLGLLSAKSERKYLHLANREALKDFFAKHTIQA